MDKAIADKWVAVLRSGKYNQTAGRLKDDKGHCCLGVLCEVLDYQPEMDEEGNYRYDGEKSILPYSAQKKADLKSSIGELPILGSQCLTEMNDDGKSFDEIAKIIENNWEML